MARNKRKDRDEDTQDTYFIPPNYVDSSGVFGGMFRLRNAIEALIIGGLAGLLLFNLTAGVGVTIRVTILLAGVVPLMFFAAIGIMGLSVTEFLYFFFRFLFKRRIIGREAYDIAVKEMISEKLRRGVKDDESDAPTSQFERLVKRFRGGHAFIKSKKPSKPKTSLYDRFSAVKKVGLSNLMKNKTGGLISGFNRSLNEVADYIPIKAIKNGIIYTTDGRYVKIIEVTPINFLLRTPKEQRSIIWSFVSFLKISPVKMQIKCLSKKADIEKHLNIARADLEKEANEECRTLQKDYMNLLYDIGSKEAVSRRFFIIFEYEPYMRAKDIEADAIANLNTIATTAKTYLAQCGNEIVKHSDDDEFAIEALYQMLNRKSSFDVPISQRKREVVLGYATNFGQVNVGDITSTEFTAPKYIDLSRMNYIKMDGVYMAYLIVPTHGFRTHVQAGWVSLLVNAGEGIDIDIYLSKEPKEKISQSLGRHIRMNKSKIKDAQDTNDDFEDLAGSIHGGYYMKRGIANNEDFYYVNMLVTITGSTKEVLDWRVREMQKKLVSQDMAVQVCTFRMEDAFLSSLPLAHMEKRLQKWSRRNMLTSGAASCYPLTSFEMCDDNGILLGVNKHNQSLIMVDVFNSRVYKNANMAILGTSGAGKSFTLQLMATRMRRKGIQVFILAPLKGHEFYRACNTIGGSFIQISPASKHCINIMEIRPVDTATTELIDEVVLDRSLLATKIDRLHIFFSLLIPDMNHEERQLLDETIIRTYQKFGITHDNYTLIDPADPKGKKFKAMPILGDLYNLLIERDETKRMANIINRLVHGSASTFNQQTNVNLDNKYIVLDISELTGDLLTVGMFVALDLVWDKAKEDRTKEKAIFIDETWRLIGGSSNRMAAEFVLEIFKIIRGYGGAAITATQDLNDFFALEDGKYGKGIVNNCKTKIVLNLEDDEADRVQEILGLSESERQAIIHFERGSAMISANKNNVVVDVKASEQELALLTTDRRELQAIAERRRAKLEYENLMMEAAKVAGDKS
ncbi:MAG: ATP-binding protein [Defluviitaleaceae bacterium]|nr:ATP-binding protein [Defluviitaleaceae bacterium]